MLPEPADLTAHRPSLHTGGAERSAPASEMGDLLSLPTLRHLWVFDAVVRFQSVSAASRALNLSQPAVSIAIASLEKRLGITLLERHHTGSVPSAYGEILLVRIRRMHQLMTQAIQKFSGSATGTESTLRKITTTHVRNLFSVSEHASVGQAARSVSISEASLYRAIRDLEKLLRRPLFAHPPGATTIMPQGAMLANRLSMALQEIRLAFEEINERRGVVSSKILIGSPSASGMAYLARAIDRLLTTYPQVTVDFVEAPYSYLLSNLFSGRIDILFDILRNPEGENEIAEERLHQDIFVVVCAPDHPIINLSKVERSHLAAYEWIIPPPEAPQFHAVQRLLGDSISKVRLITTAPGLTRALLAGNNRLTLLMRQEALREERLGALRIVPFAGKLTASLGIVSRKSWLPTKIQLAFLQMVRDAIRDQRQSVS